MAVLLADTSPWTWQATMAAMKRPLHTSHYAAGPPPLPTVVEHMRSTSPDFVDYRPPKKKFKDAHRLFNNEGGTAGCRDDNLRCHRDDKVGVMMAQSFHFTVYFTLYQLKEPRPILTVDVNLMSWVKKQPENWTSSEVLDWVYFMAKESPGVDGTTFRGDRFRSLNGQQLCDMTVEQFQEKDPINGIMLHAVLQRLLRIMNGPRKTSQTDVSIKNTLLSHYRPIASKPTQTDEMQNRSSAPINYTPSQLIYSKQGLQNHIQDVTTSSQPSVLLQNSSVSYIPPQDSIAQPSVICSASSVGDTSQQPQDYTSSSTGLLQFRPPSDPIQTSRPSMPDVPYPFYRPPRSNLLHEQPQFSQARLDNGLDALQSYPDQSVPIYLPPGNVAEQHAHLQPDELRQRLQMAPRLGMDGIKRSPGRPRKNPDAPLDLIKPKGKRGRKPGQTTKGNHLWEFIRDLLQDPDFNPSHVRWEDRQNGIFMIVRSNEVAQMWGMHKNNKSMTYEKFSRSMRYAREVENFTTVPKDGSFPKKLCFQFGNKSKGWKEDNAGSIVTKGWRIDGRGAKPKVKVKSVNENDDEECMHGRSKLQCFECGLPGTRQLNALDIQMLQKIKSSKAMVFNTPGPIPQNVLALDAGKPLGLNANLNGYHAKVNCTDAKLEQGDLKLEDGASDSSSCVSSTQTMPPVLQTALGGRFQPSPLSSERLQPTPPVEEDSDDDDPINVLDVSNHPDEDQDDTPPNSMPPLLDGPYEDETRPGSSSSNVTDASSLLLKKGDHESNPTSPETTVTKANSEALQPYPGPPPALIPTKDMPETRSPPPGLMPRHPVPLSVPLRSPGLAPPPMFSTAPGLVPLPQPIVARKAAENTNSLNSKEPTPAIGQKSGKSPGLIPASPGFVPASPGLIPASPGLIPASPGLIPASPGLIPASPGLIPASPGLIPASPGIIPASPGLIPVSELSMPPPVQTSSPRPQVKEAGVAYSTAGSMPPQHRFPTGPFSNGVRPLALPPASLPQIQQPFHAPVLNTSSGPVRIIPSLVHTRNGPVVLTPQVVETSSGPVLVTPQVAHTKDGPVVLHPQVMETIHGPILVTPPMINNPPGMVPPSPIIKVIPDSVVQPNTSQAPAKVSQPPSSTAADVNSEDEAGREPFLGRRPGLVRVPIGEKKIPSPQPSPAPATEKVESGGKRDTPSKPTPPPVSESAILGCLSAPATGATGPDGKPLVANPSIVETPDGPILLSPPMIRTSNGPVLLPPPIVQTSKGPMLALPPMIQTSNGPVMLSPPVLVDSEEAARKSLPVVHPNSLQRPQRRLSANIITDEPTPTSSAEKSVSSQELAAIGTDSMMSNKTPVLQSMLNKKRRQRTGI